MKVLVAGMIVLTRFEQDFLRRNWLSLPRMLASNHRAAQGQPLGLRQAAGGNRSPSRIDVDAAPKRREAVSEALTLFRSLYMREQHERQIWPVMLHDQNEVFQFRVIKRSDQFRITQRFIEMREHGLITPFESGDEALEPLTAQGQGKGGFHGI